MNTIRSQRIQAIQDILKEKGYPKRIFPSVEQLQALSDLELAQKYVQLQMKLCKYCWDLPWLEERQGDYRAVCCQQRTGWARLEDLPAIWNAQQEPKPRRRRK